MINIKDNRLYIDGFLASDLAMEYGTPLYIMSEESIRAKLKEVKKDFLKKHPNTRGAYAAKAFLSRDMCNILNSEGMCMDVVSLGEMALALECGFPGERMELNGNNKSIEEIEMAVKNNIGRIIIDGVDEIDLIEEVCEKFNKKVDVLIRISPGVDSHTHEYITTGQLDSKFGIPLFDEIFFPTFEKINESSYCNLLGFHFHVGSQLHNNKSHLMALSVLFDLIDEVNRKYDFITREINVGGGFGIRYIEGEEEMKVSHFTQPIMEEIERFFLERKMEMPAVVIEPGRSIVGNAGVTLYSVGTIKDIPNIRKYVSVDGGMTDNIRPALYESKYTPALVDNVSSESLEKITICGKCCESGDILAKDVYLPKVKRGDIIAILGTGAYCYSMASNYNKIPKASVVFTKEGSSRLSIKRETYSDLIK